MGVGVGVPIPETTRRNAGAGFQAASNLVGVDRFEEDGHEGVGVGVAAVLELVLDDRWTERGLGWGYCVLGT